MAAKLYLAIQFLQIPFGDKLACNRATERCTTKSVGLLLPSIKWLKERSVKSSIPGLYSLVLANGYFYAAVSKVANTENLFLDLGNETAPFSDCDHDPVTCPIRWDVSKAPLNATATDSDKPEKDIFKCQVNKLEHWTLTGQDTVQLQICDRERPQKITFQNPLVVMPSEAPAVLKAKLANHRARAKLCLAIQNPETGATSEGPPADAGGITWRNVIPGTA